MIKLIKDILQKENIKFSNITKSTSGFTNEVYFADDKYVIKVSSAKNQAKLNKEIAFYKNSYLEFIPKYIASGCVGDCSYLIISKLKGSPLYSIWHTLDNNERKRISIQVGNILKTFNKLSQTFLEEKYVQTNWSEKWQRSFALNIDILQKRGFEVEYLKAFAKNSLDNIMSQQKLGLVYNDAHFDNFLKDEEKLYLIDFDRILYGSIDYELLIISQMLDNPCKFANEEDEKNVRLEDYAIVWDNLKSSYPELFDFECLEDRVFIYKFIYRLGAGYEYDRNDWIEKELNLFKKHFNL